ncbi:putative 1-aminocyclopropane-1-carboxylate deaminase [Stylophora pistillata]|uniref:Putative 1-aminocyclopropane-1-carboxylate deaminase n=1 Tax=Stylophora pistillata TaxID=50429 RepID=A0A2B4SC63_STYPI|nr:putative 1-aminocyclopropane-1-carboxylate deaminase [Stylophora pistillata]
MNAHDLAQLHVYEPPKWASSLKNIPKYSIKLAQRNTPIHSWNLPNAPKEFSISIKRDDLTGCTLSGNKNQAVPLEFRQPHMSKSKQGLAPYLIEVGGSSYTGLFGYLTAFQEMMDQNLLEDFDDIVMTAASGGTAAGIAIANYLTGSKLKCHAVNVSDNDANVYSKINEELMAAGLLVEAEDIIDVIGGHHLPGYERPSQEDLEYILEISSSTGVLLDPVYNIKTVRGMLAEMTNNPKRFKGNRILFIHTGGCFGLFDGRIDSLLTSSRGTECNNNILCWRDIDDPLPI